METTVELNGKTRKVKADVGVTFSEMWAFKNCRQRWAYNYKERITTKIDHPALFLGSLIHEACGWYYTSKFKDKEAPSTENLTSKFLLDAETQLKELQEQWGSDKLAQDIELLDFQKNLGVAMLTGFHAFAQKNDHFTIEPINDQWPVELKFQVPILTPNGNPSNKFFFQGRIDSLVHYLGHWWVHEIKTAKQWSEGDVDLLPIDPQVAGYIYGAEKLLGIKIAGAIYTVLKKSSLRQGKNETVEGFRARVIKDYASRPDFYFARNSIYVNRDAIENVSVALWEVAKDMSSPRLYKNVGKSTCGFGCPFRRLCTSTDRQQYEGNLSMFYRKKTSKHEELEDG